MVWHGLKVEEMKRRFIVDRLSGEWDDMSGLCAVYGISRETGYRLMRRFASDGFGCVVERSHAPHVQGRMVEEDVRLALVDCRLDHPTWGPRKLKAYLERVRPETIWPAASTIGSILSARQLVGHRRRRRSALPLSRPFAAIDGANQTWSIDFKGWFRTGDNRRCDPLTMTDSHSRYLLCCRICPQTTQAVEAETDRIFKQFGLPDRLRMDNGAPWGSSGAGGLTHLSVKWAKLGIGLEFITPASPEQNGRHERMHATLKADTLRPPAATPKAQQARFDRFRTQFNTERPHEALGQQPPASFYQPSNRPYPHRIEEPEYQGVGLQVRRVRHSGEIKWNGDLVYISMALVGEPVGIEETETGDHLVRFIDIPLGIIERKTGKFRRYQPQRPPDGGDKNAEAEANLSTIRSV